MAYFPKWPEKGLKIEIQALYAPTNLSLSLKKREYLLYWINNWRICKKEKQEKLCLFLKKYYLHVGTVMSDGRGGSMYYFS